MCRKKMEPHKCEFVPESEALSLIISLPEAFEKLSQLHQLYRKALHESKWPSHWRVRNKQFIRSPEAKAVNALIQLRFNYTDSYVNTGDCLRRFVLIYEQHRSAIERIGFMKPVT